LSDSDRLKRQSAESRVAEIKEVVEQLKVLLPPLPKYMIGGDELLNELITEYPDVVKAYRTIQEEGIIRCKYKEVRMKNAVKRVFDNAKFYHPKVLKDIHTKFHVTGKKEKPPINMYIITSLQDIFDRHGIDVKAEPIHILLYFNGYQTTTTLNRQQEPAYRLTSIRPEAKMTASSS
jgi:hypothetical protein